jgi:TRAP-type mannitol/chloroaromatic compound transport system permease small subunit
MEIEMNGILIGYMVFLLFFCLMVSTLIVAIFWRKNYEKSNGEKMTVTGSVIRIILLGLILFVGSAFIQMQWIFK